jgi:hypothetical protein
VQVLARTGAGLVVTPDVGQLVDGDLDPLRGSSWSEMMTLPTSPPTVTPLLLVCRWRVLPGLSNP